VREVIKSPLFLTFSNPRHHPGFPGEGSGAKSIHATRKMRGLRQIVLAFSTEPGNLTRQLWVCASFNSNPQQLLRGISFTCLWRHPMESVHEDRYVVFVRDQNSLDQDPDTIERPLQDFPTYEEAERVKLAWHNAGRVCVIRYVGATGGGD
jgi:hypothetical protein